MCGRAKSQIYDYKHYIYSQINFILNSYRNSIENKHNFNFKIDFYHDFNNFFFAKFASDSQNRSCI